jgi:hypothetical protein
MDATIAGHATMATNARATRMSCIAGSLNRNLDQSRSLIRRRDQTAGNEGRFSNGNQSGNYQFTLLAREFNRKVYECRTFSFFGEERSLTQDFQFRVETMGIVKA